MATKKRVLIADDDLSIRYVLENFLLDLGYEVSQADNGATASLLLDTEEFELAILDINMPRRDGLEVLKQMPTHLQTPVIIMTA